MRILCQVSMQAMNSNGSVSCDVLSNVSIIARLRKYYEIVWAHLCWPQTSMISLVSDIFEACVYNLDTSIDVRTGMPSFGKTSSEPRFQGTVKRVHNRVLRYRFPAKFFMIILPSHLFRLEIPIPPTNEFRGNWISQSISVRPFTLAGKPGSIL